MIKLHDLQPPDGSNKRGKRKARGIGGKGGKTAGRGTKGQRARNTVPIGFEGGQTPLYIRMPKVGRNNGLAKPLDTVNLDKIESYVHQGKIDNTQTIKIKDLFDSGIVGRHVRHGIKLLGSGKNLLTTPLHLEVTRASQSAIAAVEKVRGM